MARQHSGLTPQESWIMELSDAGHTTRAIARITGTPHGRTRAIVNYYSEGDSNRRYRRSMALASGKLLSALVAAHV